MGSFAIDFNGSHHTQDETHREKRYHWQSRRRKSIKNHSSHLAKFTQKYPATVRFLRMFPTSRTRQSRSAKSASPGVPGTGLSELNPSPGGASRAQAPARRNRGRSDRKHFANLKPSLRGERSASAARWSAGGSSRDGQRAGQLRAPSRRGAGAPRSSPAQRRAAPGCSPPQVRSPAKLPLRPDGGTVTPETPDRAGSPRGRRQNRREEKRGTVTGTRRGHRALRAPAPARCGEKPPRRDPQHSRAPSARPPSPGDPVAARRPVLTAVLQAAARRLGEAPPPRPVPAAVRRPRPSAPTSKPRPRS